MNIYLLIAEIDVIQSKGHLKATNQSLLLKYEKDQRSWTRREMQFRKVQDAMTC